MQGQGEMKLTEAQTLKLKNIVLEIKNEQQSLGEAILKMVSSPSK